MSDQDEIDTQHPDEWVKHTERMESWITSALNKAAEMIIGSEPVEDLDVWLSSNPAPLPPNKR